MPFPSPATNGQTYTAGGFVYTYNSTKKTWVKTGYASTVEIGNVAISANASTITVGNTSISANGISVGNTTITANAITVGNTSITSNAITVGNSSITANAITVGNTIITANAVTVGNTSITANAITVGNTRITTNTVSTGNTVVSPEKITTGNTTITANSVTTGNVSISDTGIRAGNAFIASNGDATFSKITVTGTLTSNIYLNDLVDVTYQTGNSQLGGFALPGHVLTWDGNEWTPSVVTANNATNANFASTADLACLALIANYTELANVANITLSLSNFTTANLTEGTSLYYTNARVASNISLLSINALYDVDTTFTNVNNSLVWNGTAWVSNVVPFASTANLANSVVSIAQFTTANLVESVVNLYFTNARSYANIAPVLAIKANVTDLTTANVIEVGDTTAGNVYFSNARARNALTGGLNIDYNKSTGVIGTANNVTFNTFTASTGTILGNLTVIGNLVTQASNADTLSNPIIFLANNSVTDVVDIGFVGTYKPAGDVSRMTGLFRDATDANYKLFQNGLYNVGTTVNTADGAFKFANLQVDTLFGKLEWANIQSKPDPVITVSLTGDVTGTASATLQDLASNTITIATVASNISPSSILSVLQNVNSGRGLTTSNVAEGSNLYYTNARVASNVALLSINVLADVDITNIVTGNSLVWDGTKFVPGQGAGGSAPQANLSNFANTAGFANTATTANVANLVLSLSNFTTSNLAEGNNLYFTNARARVAVDNQTLQNIYIANLSAGNLTYVGNLIVDNLTASNGFIRLNSGGPNTTIQAGIWNYDFRNDGNLYVPNIVVTGAIFGNITGSINVGTLTSEQVQDYAAALFTSGTHSGVTVDYDDNNNKINLTVAGGSGGAAVANLANIANIVLSLTNLTTSNLNEGSNLYFTNARVISSVSAANISNLTVTGNVVANKFIGDGSLLTGITASSSASVSNLAQLPSYNGNALIGNLFISGNGTSSEQILIVSGNAGISGTLTAGNVIANRFQGSGALLTGISTTNVSEGTNLYYTNARVLSYITPYLTTSNVSEGTNLYYTNARVISQVSNVSLANLTVANIRIGPNSSITATSDANTTIVSNGHVFVFGESGLAILPNVSVRNNLYISDKVVYSTAARVAGNIIPLLDNVYSLGSPTSRFQKLYVSGSTIDIGDALFKFEDGKFKFQTASGAPAQTEIFTGNIIEQGDTTLGNVYFTNARARAAFANGVGIAYNTSTGVISIGQNVSTTSDVTFNSASFTGNVLVTGNVTAAKFFGDGSGLTNLITPSVTSNLSLLSTYNGNALVGNIVVSGNASSGNILTVAGNASIGNIVVTGKIFGDGSGLTGITASGITGINQSNLAQLPTYNGNVLAGNIVISGNATLGNILVVTGNALLGNVYATRFIGDGSQISGISASGIAGINQSNLAQLPTYNGNALLGNVVITGNATTGNILVVTGNASIGNIFVTGKIFGDGSGITGLATSSNFANNSNVANVVLSLSNFTTSNLAEGTNLYYTNARVYSNIFPLLTTANISEIVNQYFTNARARLAISGGTGVDYNNTTGLISIGQNVSTTASVSFKDITLSGNLTVLGTTTTLNARSLQISDNMIYLNQEIPFQIINAVGNGANVVYTTALAHGAIVGETVRIAGVSPISFNTAGYNSILAVTANTITIASSVTDSYISGGNLYIKTNINPDIGFAGGYNDGTGYAHTGFFRDATDGTYKIYEGYLPEPDANIFIDTSNSSFRLANLLVSNLTARGNIVAGNITATRFVGDGSQLTGITASAITGVNTSNLDQLPRYNGNALLGNVVITGNASTGNILIVNGNASIGNLYVTGKLFGDGSGLSGISTSLSGMATYNGNILASNLVVTGNAVVNSNLTVLGNLIAGNVTATRFVGDGGQLTGVLNIASLNTYGGNILVSNLVVAGNATVTGNLVVGNASISTSADNNTEIRAGIWVYRFSDTGVASLPNVTVTGNIVFGNSTLLNTPDNNTQIRAGIWTYTFTDTGNLLVPNISASGNIVAGNIIATRFVGDGSALTGIATGLGQLTTYNGNILAGNLVITGNATTGNVLVVTGNASITGNIVAGNVTATRFVGDGSQLTGITASAITGVNTSNLDQLPRYNGNALLGNVVITGNASTGNILVVLGNAFISGNILAGNVNANAITAIRFGGNIATFTSNVTVGNIIVGNVISTPAGSNANLIIDPDGTGEVIFPVNTEVVIQSTIQANSNVSGALVVTGGIGVGGNIYSGANIVATGNVIGTYFLGNGALLSGISTSLAGMSTYNGNILASNIVVTSNLTIRGNLNVGNATTINSTGDNNTQIRAGIWTYTFSDTGIVSFPNVTITGNLNVGNNQSFAFVNDNNTTIRAGNFVTRFLDLGNITVTGNVIATQRVSANIVQANTFVGDSVGNIAVTGNVIATQRVSANIVQANTFVGDGSGLTGVTSGSSRSTIIMYSILFR